MFSTLPLLVGCGLAVALGACAFDVIHVEQYPTRLESLDASKKPLEMLADVNLAVGFGYQRILKKGTRWRYVGHVAQGDVYTTSDQVLTVEASNIQEAYIVIVGRALVGFYLPVEKAFSPLAQRTELVVRELP